jgi:hypothetical protein
MAECIGTAANAAGAGRCGHTARTSAQICHLILVPIGHPAKPVKLYALPN